MEEKQYDRNNEAPKDGIGNREGNFSETITVIEEKYSVEKKLVETGKVRIAKTVHEHETDVTIPLMHEEFDIERVPVNQYMPTQPPPVRYEGDVMIIPVIREVMVVEKRYELLEEVRITKRKVETQETQKVTLLKEEIHIERTGGKTPAENGK